MPACHFTSMNAKRSQHCVTKIMWALFCVGICTRRRTGNGGVSQQYSLKVSSLFDLMWTLTLAQIYDMFAWKWVTYCHFPLIYNVTFRGYRLSCTSSWPISLNLLWVEGGWCAFLMLFSCFRAFVSHHYVSTACFSNTPLRYFFRTDSSGPMSTAHTHPPPMGGMVGHPSVISTSRPLPSPMSTLGSPMNGLASPYSVITSSLGSPSVSLPSTPSMNFGALNSPQVRGCVCCFDGH